MIDLVVRSVRSGDLCVLSGSLPPGSPPDLYGTLIQSVQALGVRALLDSSGLPLREGLAALPYGSKLNGQEADEMLGVSLSGDDGLCAVAKQLQARGMRLVALTSGPEGLVLALGDDLLIARPADISARSLWAQATGRWPVWCGQCRRDLMRSIPLDGPLPVERQRPCKRAPG